VLENEIGQESIMCSTAPSCVVLFCKLEVVWLGPGSKVGVASKKI